MATNIINDDIPNADASFRPCPIRLVWLVVDIPGTDDSGCEALHSFAVRERAKVKGEAKV